MTVDTETVTKSKDHEQTSDKRKQEEYEVHRKPF